MPSQPSPDATTADQDKAAGLARDCAVMSRAYRLARWIGTRRQVTAGQVLRRADVPAAGAALGVAVPAKVRTAADLPALHRPWCVAVAVGLLTVGGGEVTAGPALASWPPAEDELLSGWLSGLRAVCVAEAGPRARDREHADLPVLALLDLLDSDGPPTGKDLWDAVHAAIRSERYDASYRFGLLDRFYDLDTGDPLGGLFALLEEFGAASGGSSDPEITPLGEWAAACLLDDLPGSADPGLSAAELLTRLAGLDDSGRVWEEAQSWLEGRAETDAARDLLATAESSSALERCVAVEVVEGLGETVLPLWQELASMQRVGPHARAVLAAWERVPALDEADRVWLVTEAAAAALASHGPDEALTRVHEGLDGADLRSRIAAAAGSGHPAAGILSRALTDFLASGAPRAVDTVLQLKVTLAGWRPPKWRRVLIPATVTLHELHRVIQVLYGWDGDHLHAFAIGHRRYSDPFFELEEADDEYGLRLARAFTPAAGKVIYTYDFGSSWRHEIVLEKAVQRTPGQAYPACVAFRGDSPVEYWSEEDPEEPAPFDQAAVNRKLAPIGE